MTKQKDMVKSYTFKAQTIDPHGEELRAGYYPETREFEPFTEIRWMHEIFDAIAAATEDGFTDRNSWVSQFFTSEEIFRKFLEEVESYEQCYRIRDRWYEALRRIANKDDEECFVTGEEIAEGLLEVAQLTGQIEQ